MRRRLFTLLAALSLVMFAAVTALWIRSHYRSDSVYYSTPHAMYQLESVSGVLVTGQSSWRSLDEKSEWHFYSDPATTDVPFFWEGHPVLTRFGFARSDWYWRMDWADAGRWFMAPVWFLMTAFGVLPLFWLIRTIRLAWSKRRGCCPGCGYDLRATPNRCPECGTPARTEV